MMKISTGLLLSIVLFSVGAAKPVTFKASCHFAINVVSYASISHLVVGAVDGFLDKLVKPGTLKIGSRIKARLLALGTKKTTCAKVLLALAMCFVHRRYGSSWRILSRPKFLPCQLVGAINYLLAPADFRPAIVSDLSL